MTYFACPCCGHKMDAPCDPYELAKIINGGVSRKILEILASKNGRGASLVELADKVYADDPNGGPETDSITVTICMIRKRLKGTGWCIPKEKSGNGCFASYRLVPENREAA